MLCGPKFLRGVRMNNIWRGVAVTAILVGMGVSPALAQTPAPMPTPIAEPQDVAYPGVITLDVDATDTMRGIWRAREVIPV